MAVNAAVENQFTVSIVRNSWNGGGAHKPVLPIASLKRTGTGVL